MDTKINKFSFHSLTGFSISSISAELASILCARAAGGGGGGLLKIHCSLRNF